MCLVFQTSIDEHEPLALKQRVFAALDGHTKEVRIRRPCVTVFYERKGEHVYHVDLALYAPDDSGQLHLARGKIGDAPSLRVWEPSDPKALPALIDSRFAGEDREQFRRVVRGLKRWKDNRFPPEGDAAPTGIAITAAAMRWFRVCKRFDAIRQQDIYDDAVAMLALVREMRRNASPRLSVRLEIPPYNDLFAAMSGRQMEILAQELGKLEDALLNAQHDTSEEQAAARLRGVFGDDFPACEDSGRGPASIGIAGVAAIGSSGSAA